MTIITQNVRGLTFKHELVQTNLKGHASLPEREDFTRFESVRQLTQARELVSQKKMKTMLT